MSERIKPKEYWINKINMVAELTPTNVLVSDPRRQLINVIEKKSYETAIAALLKIANSFDCTTMRPSYDALIAQNTLKELGLSREDAIG